MGKALGMAPRRGTNPLGDISNRFCPQKQSATGMSSERAYQFLENGARGKPWALFSLRLPYHASLGSSSQGADDSRYLPWWCLCGLALGLAEGLALTLGAGDALGLADGAGDVLGAPLGLDDGLDDGLGEVDAIGDGLPLGRVLGSALGLDDGVGLVMPIGFGELPPPLQLARARAVIAARIGRRIDGAPRP